MSDEISSNSADLYNKLSAAIGKQSGKISESAEQVNLSVFKDNDPIKGKIQDALLKFRRNNGNNEISSLNKPAENHINPDGSGTKVTQKTDKNGNVITETVTMGPGGKVLSKNSMVKNKNGKMINNTTTSYTYDTGGKIQSLLSRINSQQPSRPVLTSEQRENLISFAHRYIAQHGITPSKANVQKILNALRELNPDAVKTENGEMYLDAGTEINLPDFDDI